jgi:AcrR family transcriptional regulator
VARPRKKSSAYHHGDVRASAALAARRIVEREGAAALSLRAVSDVLGVTHRSLYRHFADKSALVSAAAALGFADLRAAMNAAHSAGEHVMSAYVRFALERRDLYRLMFALPAKRLMGDAELGAEVQACVAIVAEAFRRPQDGPGVSAALRDRAIGAIGLAHGLCDLWHARALRAKDVEAAQAYILKLAREVGLLD